ncbi:hypothetical protein Glove_74g115 [Diversispora epigaea]|uniref:BTB domain-containing protein n=1 Tax=Diversispora epigaea TaxID=1348612 RepID=A0A397J946_9GLOM|nr:hypothetical protein Glove_74g115 [Diversispora epigaea]
MQSGILENGLIRDIRRLYDDSEDYNVVIACGQKHDVDKFKAHSVILRARSSYFRELLPIKNIIKGGIITLSLPNIPPNVFEILLRYIYTGTLDLNEDATKSVFLELLTGSHGLNLQELTEHIQNYIVEQQPEWIRQHLVQLIKITSEHQYLAKIKSYCQMLVNESPSEILKAGDFYTLEEEYMSILIQRDDLRIPEIEVWDSVLKWGVYRNKTLGPDVSKWTDEDMDTLGKTVQNLIPHIRFFNISGEDHRKRIRPYKKILPKGLREEIKDYFFAKLSPQKFAILPPRNTSENAENVFNSKLLNMSHFCQLASWIDNFMEMDPDKSKNLPYTFHLLLRGSRDGTNDAVKFHEQCDGQGPTIVIIEIANSNKLLGGYNPNDWKSEGGWGETASSFLFSMERNTTDANILSRNKSSKSAIWNAAKNPSFSHDLQWFLGKCILKSYERPILDRDSFSLTDYEVFKVIKKSDLKNDNITVVKNENGKRVHIPEEDNVDLSSNSDSGDSIKRLKPDDNRIRPIIDDAY